MGSKKGISLVVLIVTIIVMIILATTVILTLNKNNPINSSKVAQLAENRANINSAIQLYYGKQMIDTQGAYNAKEIYTQSFVEGDKKAIVTDETVTINSLTLYKLDENNVKDELGIQLPTISNATWYLDVEIGLVYLVYEQDAAIPNWMYTDDQKLNMDTTLANFVKSKV